MRILHAHKSKTPQFKPWTCMGERCSSYLFLKLVVDEDELSDYAPIHSLPWGKWPPSNRCIGVWVGITATLDAEAGRSILCIRWGLNPSYSACSQFSQLLCSLCYVNIQNEVVCFMWWNYFVLNSDKAKSFTANCVVFLSSYMKTWIMAGLLLIWK